MHFDQSRSAGLHNHPIYSARHKSEKLTFAAAFLYRRIDSMIRSRTSKSPAPHGTTTRTAPKHTVTFILTFVFGAHSIIPFIYSTLHQFSCFPQQPITFSLSISLFIRSDHKTSLGIIIIIIILYTTTRDRTSTFSISQ